MVVVGVDIAVLLHILEVAAVLPVGAGVEKPADLAALPGLHLKAVVVTGAVGPDAQIVAVVELNSVVLGHVLDSVGGAVVRPAAAAGRQRQAEGRQQGRQHRAPQKLVHAHSS